jgi:RHH-type proline utilization regulon transcriptional repressor/proline dehydrogenase/delta 1-pyrroline-5-carboxylate dehydrogenase
LITANLPGEENILTYHPRGITTVIAPWNFPLAIACGMTVASLVAGNATVLKPAEESSGIAFTLAKLILAAKIPAGVFALLPGKGETIGRALIEDPRTTTICFTGSRTVGLEILGLAAKVHPKQTRIKRVIAEMGGKNAIIVDDDADLDDVIRGVLYSAFGYSGQKCSACSRLIVVGKSTYEKLLNRLSEATKDLIIGSSHNSDTFMGPVISKETAKSISDFIERAKHLHKIVTIGHIPSDLTGFFVPPVVFRDVPEETPLWQEEIFGPVLACNMANSFKDAVAMANRSEYALTGSVYSRHPEHINYARKYFEVGNLYINRGSTGALVGRQPFGGFKMSGIGSKAGGPDYLLQFLEPRVTSENTTRKGFIPEID